MRVGACGQAAPPEEVQEQMFDIDDATPPLPPASPGPRSAAQPGGRAGLPIEPRRVLWELKRRQRWIWLSTILGAVLGCAAALKWAPREFAVTSLLTWDSASLMSGGDRDTMRAMHTLVDSVKTPAVLLEVRQRLGIASTVESLGARIEVTPDDRSNMITLTAVGASAQEALELNQTTLDVFQKQRLIAEKKQGEYAATALAERLAVARQELGDLRAQQAEFLKEQQITDLQGELAQASSDATRYQQEQVGAGADAAAEQARLDSLNDALQHNAQTVVLSEKVVHPDAAKLADIEAELAGLRSGGLSEDHPRIKMLEAQAKALRQHKDESWSSGVVTERSSGRNPELGSFQSRIIDAKAAREAAAGREKALAQLVIDATAKVERLRAIERRGADLAHAIASGEAHVSELDAARLAAVEQSRTPVTGLSLLEAPALPNIPRKSLRKPYAVAGLFIGALGSFALVLLWSLRGLKIHTSTELAFWGNGPVITSTQWPLRPLFDELREELARQLVQAPPGVLFIPAGARELELLRELASRSGWPECTDGNEGLFPVSAWLAAPSGHMVRKAVKAASRVVVLVCSGERSAFSISELPMRVGARGTVGYVLVDVTDELSVLPEQVGDAASFWRPVSEPARLRVVG